MIRILKNAPFDILFIAALYYGCIEHTSEAIENVALFIGWFLAVTCFVVSIDKDETVYKRLMKDEGPRTWSFAIWDVGTDVIITLLMAASAHYIMATLFVYAVCSKNRYYKNNRGV